MPARMVPSGWTPTANHCGDARAHRIRMHFLLRTTAVSGSIMNTPCRTTNVLEEYARCVTTYRRSRKSHVNVSRNVRDSDATLIVSHGAPTGGSLLTLEEARRSGKPVLHLDLLQLAPASAAAQLLEWLAAVDPAVLNVAGPRDSEDATIYAAAAALLRTVLQTD
jgi:hypothetical protein